VLKLHVNHTVNDIVWTATSMFVYTYDMALYLPLVLIGVVSLLREV